MMDTPDMPPDASADSEDLPDALSPEALRRIVGRAKRWTIFRTVVVSCLSLAVLGGAAWVADQLWLNRVANRLVAQIPQQLALRDPDVWMGAYQVFPGFFGGTLTVRTFKLIGTTPIPWTTWHFAYNLFGGLELPGYGDQSPAPQIPTPEGVRLYNDQTEQRIMAFYLPGAHYAQHFNDLARLGQLPPQDTVEMAISFTRAFTFSEVNAMLPPGIQASWYWVDTYSSADRRAKDPLPYSSATGTIFGFPRQAFADPSAPQETPADFLNALEAGTKSPAWWSGQDRRILQTLAQGKGAVTPSRVRIIGVVVTGTPRALQALQGQPYVRASSLGAMAPPE